MTRIRRIWEYLNKRGPADAPTISRALGVNLLTVQSALFTLRRDGMARVIGMSEERFKVIEACGKKGPLIDGRGQHPNSAVGRARGPQGQRAERRVEYQIEDGFGAGKCELEQVWR